MMTLIPFLPSLEPCLQWSYLRSSFLWVYQSLFASVSPLNASITSLIEQSQSSATKCFNKIFITSSTLIYLFPSRCSLDFCIISVIICFISFFVSIYSPIHVQNHNNQTYNAYALSCAYAFCFFVFHSYILCFSSSVSPHICTTLVTIVVMPIICVLCGYIVSAL